MTAALVSAIRFVPEAHPSHTVYLGIFQKMASSIAAAQAADGSCKYPPTHTHLHAAKNEAEIHIFNVRRPRGCTGRRRTVKMILWQ